MKYSLPVFLSLLFAPFCGLASQSETIFSESFEGDTPLERWTIQSTNTGRIQVVEDASNPDNHGLLMDDATDDATFSHNVARTVVPIRGYKEVRIAVDVTSFNDEVHTENGFDGLVVGAGNMSAHQEIDWNREQMISIQLTPEMEAYANEVGFLTIELHQYDNFSAPEDGLFFDNVRVSGKPMREIHVESPWSVSEDDPLALTVLIDPVPNKDVALDLQLESGEVHGTAIYPAGAAMAELTFPSFANDHLDGDRFRRFTVSDGDTLSLPFSILVEDTTLAGLRLIVPQDIPEGEVALGRVAVSVSRSSWITIDLESSDPSVLAVPERVNLGPWTSSVSFALETIADLRVLDDRSVTITASVGGDVVGETVLVLEQNTLTPVIAGPSDLVEGTDGAAFSFTLDGISDEAITVSLAATPDDVSIDPQTITLEPGERTGDFVVNAADDTEVQGNRPFAITATTGAGESSTFEGTIVDNDIAGFAFDLPEMIEAEVGHPLVIRAVNQNGNTVEAFEGEADLFLRDRETGEESTLAAALQFEEGTGTTNVNFAYSSRGKVLLVRSSNGIEALSAPLSVFAKLTFAANDVVYDSERETLYTVSGGAAISGHLHSVTPIDPETTEIGDPLFLGNDPRNIVITDDAQYLYVGLYSSYSVRRVGLEDFSLGDNIPLDASGSWAGDSYTPYGLLPLPGRPRDILVSQDHTGSTYWTTRLYIDGQVQPTSARDAIQMVPAGAPDEFYAFNSSDTGFDFMRLRLTDDGYETVATQHGLFSGFSTQVAGGDDLIFSNGGRVVDGLKMEIVADLRFPSGWSTSSGAPPMTMLADPDRSRFYYAHGNSIAAYDTAVFQLVGEATVPGIGEIKRMVRWGDAGLALLTEDAEVVLLENSRLVPSGPSTDLAVTISAAPDPVFLGEDLTYSAGIENTGEAVAHDVQLIFSLNEGQAFKSVTNGEFDYRTEENNVIIEIGDMEPGVAHHFSVTATPTALTTLVGSVAAVTRSPDVEYGNNKAAAVLNVGFRSKTNSVNIVQIPTNDVQTNPVTGELVLAVSAEANEAIANRIMTIDPLSGLITQSIPVSAEPGLMALSDDGSTVYALTPNRNAALRVDLETGQFLGSVSFGSDIRVDDLKVLNGTVDSLVVGSGWDGVRVYDKGVVRPKNSGTYNGDLVALLPDPSLVFAYNNEHTGFESFRFQLDAGGVNHVQESNGLFSGFYISIESDGYFVYGTAGKSVRADLMALDGTFPLTTAFSGSSSGTTAVEPERAVRRVYYSRYKEIASFDSESYLHVRTQNFENLPGTIVGLERWGSDGFAARLQNGHLAIIRTDLVSDAASPIDLLVSIPDDLEVSVPTLTIEGHAYSGQGISNVTVAGRTATSYTGFANWSITIPDLEPGENILEITATAFGSPAATRTVTRTVHYLSEHDSIGDGLADSWVVENFGALDASLAGPEVDADGDGSSNLHEFLFGTDPLQADAPFLTVRRSEANDGSGLLIEFIQRDTGGYRFEIESSVDLQVWKVLDSVESAGDPVPVDGLSGYVRASYRVQPAGDAKAEFYRVRAAR